LPDKIPVSCSGNAHIVFVTKAFVEDPVKNLQEEVRSKRTGRLPRLAYNAQREAADDNHAQNMQDARRELSTLLFDRDQNCIARMRLAKGISQSNLAKIAGLTQPHLAKIESGKLSIRFSTALQLADALQVSLDELRPLVNIDAPVGDLEFRAGVM